MSIPTTPRVYNVLFLCTGNSARSILAESILNREGQGRFRAFSAGSHPRGQVHPAALDLLGRLDYPVEGLRSKSWDEFAQPGAPRFDFVFTVCDSAAGEVCPYWPDAPITAHWGIEDPSDVEGTLEEMNKAFSKALRYLKNRIALLVSLPLDRLDRMAIASKVEEIGRVEGASAGVAPSTSALPYRPDVLVYHNPECGTSRNTLAMIRATGTEPHVVEYLKTPPSRALLAQLIQRAGLTVRAALREKGTPFAELGLQEPSLSDDQLLDAMMAHPILINRPLVVTPAGVRLCRPSERVLGLLPGALPADFRKEDGEQVTGATGERVA